MKITTRQLNQLIHVLQDSLKMRIIGYFSSSFKFRAELLQEIINQQDNKTFLEVSEDK